MLVHNVYFTLKDHSPKAVEHLLAECRKYLQNHPGIKLFACGTLSDLDRPPVQDRNFDVGLHIVFEDRASHDRYQTDPQHVKFIETNRDGWQQVRVFDSDA